jgi:hypothetical protein
MEDSNKETPLENLTQKDIIQLLLHNAQHMVTREEVKSDIKEVKDELKAVKDELKADISRVEDELKLEIKEVKDELKADILKVEDRISKIDLKFDRLQWLIVATMVMILAQDYIFSFIRTLSVVNP